MNPAAQRRLMGHAFLGCLNCHVRNGVGCVRTINLGSADGQVLEVGVTGEEACGVLGNGPCPFRIFQPQALNVFQCGIIVNLAGFQICLIVGVHILVETARVPCQRVFGDNAAQLNEPYELDCLPETFRRVGGHGCANLCDFFQLSLSLCVRLHGSHFRCFLGIAAAEGHHAVCNHNDGFIEVHLLFLFRNCLIELAHVLFGFLLDAGISFRQQNINVVCGDFADAVSPFRVGIQESRVNADFLRCLGGTGQKCLLNGFALPVGENVFPNELRLLGGNIIGVLSPFRERVDFIVNPQPAEFRRQDCAFAILAACTDNKLTFPDVDRQFVAGVLECLCNTNDVGKTFGPLKGFGPAPGSLVRNVRFCIYIVLANFFNSFSDSHFLSVLSLYEIIIRGIVQ